MIRSAKMKAIAPPKLMPPISTALRPAEYSRPSIRTRDHGPTSGPNDGVPTNLASNGWSMDEETDCQNSAGTQAASAPEISRAAGDGPFQTEGPSPSRK